MAPEEADALRDEYLRVPAANRADVHIALVIDVGDDHPDLVDVAGEHDRRAARRVHDCHRVAGHIGVHLSREAARLLPPDGGGGAFVP